VNFDFTAVGYDRAAFLTDAHPSIPKGSAVYRIFDKRNKLIVLDKTSNLSERLERYFGERNERVRDLDLREIAGRIEFRRTWSPFETTYVLYVQRREFFPKTYRKMRTFRLFTLLKLNRKQRFPRIYASRDIKAGAEYFGPFETRSQFTRLKTELERTFRLRPCLYNIRGDDPHPDCLYFQMHTCSRPCNNDIDRPGYLADAESAMEFIQGNDERLSAALRAQVEALAAEEQFEEAGALQRKAERIQRARKEIKETYRRLWRFDYLVLMPADSTSRVNVAFCRSGGIVRFDTFDAASVVDTLPEAAARELSSPPPAIRRDWQYDEFCLVAGYLLHPLKSVEVLPMNDDAALRAHLRKRGGIKGN
jgi:DNA polymerase-3 subunit epsilon